MWSRRLIAVVPALALSACATVPPPPRTDAFARDFAVCASGVSNAPETDSRGRITRYQPFATFRGVKLARQPVEGCLSSGFGQRTKARPGASGFHSGLDISTGFPRPVHAAGAGVVTRAESAGTYGNVVEIRHARGVTTLYAHLSEFKAKKGDRVGAGEVIGLSGRTGDATGVHLHYEIRVDGGPVNPLTVGR